MTKRGADRVIALSGGVGGAKLALGLSQCVAGDRLTICCNTGDDFEHLGLHVAPDVDTVVYTLAGLANVAQGWGREGESWSFMAALKILGGPSWFSLGDGDLAMHVRRTRLLADGQSLSAVTAEIARALGIRAHIVPMSDQPVRTMLETDQGRLGFQDYFVRLQCRPVVRTIEFDGADAARPSPALEIALDDQALAAIIFCPSNPYLSLGPILAVTGIDRALRNRRVPAVAVAPVVVGQAIKGPTAKIMTELGQTADAVAVARLLAPYIDGFVIDDADRALAPRIEALGLRVSVAPIVMRTTDDKVLLARRVLDFAKSCAVPGAG